VTEQSYVCLLLMLSCDFACCLYVAVARSTRPSVRPIQAISRKQKGVKTEPRSGGGGLMGPHAAYGKLFSSIFNVFNRLHETKSRLCH